MTRDLFQLPTTLRSSWYSGKENEVIFVLGSYMELVDREVIGKQKDLLVDTVRGALGAKIKYMALASKSFPEN